MMKKVFLCVLVVLAMTQFMVEQTQAIGCADVARCLLPCMPYLTGAAAAPVVGCCAGVKQLQGMAVTTPDKREACTCVKEAASHYENIKDEAATGLASKCGVSLPFSVSKNIDCNAIN